MTRLKTKPELREMSAPGMRDGWSSYPSSGLTPGRLSAILREADAGDPVRQMELYGEMEEKDAHLYSLLQTRKLAVAGSQYEVVPADETEPGRDAAGFVRDALTGIDNFEESMMDLMDAVGKGFSVSEIIWRSAPAGFVPVELRKRRQKRFTFTDADGRPTGPMLVDPYSSSPPRPLAHGKFMVHVYRAGADSPERGGLLRVLGWIYLFKNYAIKDWVSFSEVFGMPVRLGVYSPAATKEDRETLAEAVKSLGSDAAGVISESTRIEFIEAARRGESGPYGALIEFLNREMSKAVLGQTLTSDVGESGSYAAGKVHDGVRLDIARADARALERTVNRDLIRPLCAYNFGPDIKPPVFRLRVGPAEDLNESVKRDRLLSEMGLELTEGYLRRKYGVPRE